MSEINSLISNIKTDILTLQEDKAKLKNEVIGLNSQIEKMKAELAEKEMKMKEIFEEHKTLKIAKSLSGTSKNSDAKFKINELVKEIDKCITLLNK